MAPREVIRVLRKRIWLIMVCVVIFTGAGGAGAYYWLKTAPTYVSAAGLEVLTPPRGEREYQGPRESIPADMPQLMATHADLMMRPDVLGEVAMDEDVRNTSWAKKEPYSALARRLGGAVSAVPRAKTRNINVFVTTNNRDDSAVIANAVCRTYVKICQDRGAVRQREYIKELEEQITDVSKELETVQAKIEDLTRGSRVADLTERNSSKKFELEVQNRQAIQFRAELMKAESFLETLLKAEEEGTLMDMPEVLGTLYQDPEYASLRQEEERLSVTLRLLQRKYGPQHSSVIETEGQLANTSAQLGAIEEGAVQAFIARYKGQVESLDSQHSRLRETIQLTQDELKDLHMTLVRLGEQRTIEARKTDTLNQLEKTLRAHRFRLKLLVPVAFRSSAVRAEGRSQPNIPIMIIGGFLLGLMVGLGLTVLLEVADTSIKRPSDIKRRVDVPLLGVVPHTRDLEEEIDDPRLALQVFPDSPFGEAFRQIRTRVLFSGPADQQRVLMVTSPLPEDGRTTVAVNLGLTMAQSGSKVLLIDANFRQPILHELFESDGHSGLSSALVEHGSWQDMLLTPGDNLDVLPAGPLPPNPAELLASPQMRNLLLAASQSYDRVLIDSGPCLVVTDPLVLAPIVDGVILTFRAGANSHGVAARAKSILADARAHMVGAVLNGVRVMAGGYMQKNYDAFYDYRERQLPA